MTTETAVEGQSSKTVRRYQYDILWPYNNRFRSKIKGEKRLDKDGNPVEWDLVLPNDSTFYWVRNDWEAGSRTKLNVKCTMSL